MGSRVPGVAGTGVLGIGGADSQAEYVVYIISSHKTGQVGYKAQSLAILLIGEIVLINVEHWPQLRPNIEATFVAVPQGLG